MLVSKPKKRDIRRGMSGNILLVPELCIMTGLSEELRSDFNVMKNLAQYMRMTPDKRVAALKAFNSDLTNNAKVIMGSGFPIWNFRFFAWTKGSATAGFGCSSSIACKFSLVSIPASLYKKQNTTSP